jgi:hypothetical protein
MFFNGFTLLLVLASIAVGFFWGIRYENDYQKSIRPQAQLDIDIEAQMAKDGWKI